jgi:tetratricopeptide (TPR) repeat protein
MESEALVLVSCCDHWLDDGAVNAQVVSAEAEFAPSTAMCRLAIEEYKKVLELDASREDAWKSLAFLLYQAGQWDESENSYRKALALKGNDPEALGGVAAINFIRSWQNLAATKNGLNLPAKMTLIDEPACAAVRDRNLARVEEGIAFLTRALQVRNNNSDLMGSCRYCT